MWKHPGAVISIRLYQSLMSMRYQFAVARGIKRTRTSTQVQVQAHKFGRPSPDKVREKINKEIEESKRKWGSTLPPRTIHFPFTERNTGVQWSPCVCPPAQNGSGHRQQYSFSFQSLSDKQRREAATDLPLRKLTQPLRKMKDNSFEPSGQFPISSRRRFDIGAHTSSLFMRPNPPEKRRKKIDKERWEWRESGRASGKMCRREESGAVGLAALDPHRLWLDIWSQSRWNVRRVMTGMVIGRLWLTPDPEVPKGHSSLNPPVSCCAFRSRRKVSEPVGSRGGKFARR